MSSIALIIDSHTLTLIEKGKPALQKNFNSEESFGEMVDKMIKHKYLKRVQFFFTGQHLISDTMTTTHTSETPFVVDKKAIEHITERATVDFLNKYNKENNFKLIIAKPITLLLNGYHVASPMQQKVRDLRLTMFMSAIPVALSEQKGEFYSFPFHLAEQIHIKQKADSFIICSSGGETIDISIKKEGDFFKTHSIAINSQTDSEIKKVLDTCFGGVALPGDVYVVVPPEVLPIIEQVFANGTYHASCMTTGGFALHTLDVTSLIEV